MARPTEKPKDLVKKTFKYLDSCTDDIENKKVNLPTIEGLALYLGVVKSTLYAWEKEDPEFSNALNQIRQDQKNRLINNGLMGTYNSTIAKLILSSNHGMAEKTDNKHSGDSDNPINHVHKIERVIVKNDNSSN